MHQLSVHGDTVPSERDAARVRKTEARSRTGKAANKCRKLEGPDRRVGRK